MKANKQGITLASGGDHELSVLGDEDMLRHGVAQPDRERGRLQPGTDPRGGLHTAFG